jgi:c-di-GMP-binding flagellar brake protein YcgR
MDPRERRRFYRLKATVAVEYIPFHQKIKIPYVTAGKNISQGGLCVILFDKVDIGQIFDLAFTLPDGREPIKARGRIAWLSNLQMETGECAEAYEAGIEFITISPDDLKKLTRFLARKKP